MVRGQGGAAPGEVGFEPPLRIIRSAKKLVSGGRCFTEDEQALSPRKDWQPPLYSRVFWSDQDSQGTERGTIIKQQSRGECETRLTSISRGPQPRCRRGTMFAQALWGGPCDHFCASHMAGRGCCGHPRSRNTHSMGIPKHVESR